MPSEESQSATVLERAWIAVIAIGLLIYTSLRAYGLSFTHDEAITFNQYVSLGPRAILDCYDANNHPLNTALMILSRTVFGTTPFTLRLPSLAAHIVYLRWAWLLARRASNPSLRLAGFLLLTLNPYVLDFFSLARGYAWALAALLGSIHFLMLYHERGRASRDLITAFTLAALAVFANYAFFIYYIGFVATYFLLERFSFRSFQPVWKHILLHLLIFLPPTINLRRQGALYYGGHAGFLADTVGTLTRSLFYDSTPSQQWLRVGIVFTLVLPALLLAWAAGRTSSSSIKPQTLVAPCVLVSVALGSYAAHAIAHVPFLMDRSALFLLPLFSLTVLSLSSRTRVPVMSILSAVFLAATLRAGNLTHTRDWAYDADTRAILDDLHTRIPSSVQAPIRLGISWTLEPSITFYRTLQHADWFAPVSRGGLAGDYDYFIYTDADSVFMAVDPAVVTMKTYPVSGTRLARFERARQVP